MSCQSYWIERSTLSYLYKRKEDIGAERPFVGLVDNQGSIARQVGFGEELTKQHAVRHVLQDSLVACAVFETYRVSHLISNFGAHFFGYTCSNRHSRNATRLGTSDFQATSRVSRLMQVLW